MKPKKAPRGEGEQECQDHEPHRDHERGLEHPVVGAIPGEEQQRVAAAVEAAQVVGVHAERGEEGARVGAGELRERHVRRQREDDHDRRHHEDRPQHRRDEALRFLRARHGRGDQQRIDHEHEGLGELVAQVAGASVKKIMSRSRKPAESRRRDSSPGARR
jgi:hypothetical protein